MFVNSNLCVWIPAVLVNRIETRRPAFRRGFCPVLCPGCCSGLFYVRFGRVRGARNPVVRRCGKSALRVESPCEAIDFPGDIDRLRVVGLLQGGNQKRQLIDHQLSFNLLILSLIFDKFFLVLSVSKRNRPWADVDEPAISLHGYPVSVSTSLLRFLIFPRHYKILQDFS